MEDSVHMNNPPHLRQRWSSALIPFCAYKKDLNISKTSFVLENTEFPLCSAFLPTVLEGQLCYKVSLHEKSQQGNKNGLTLLIDNNEDRSLQIQTDSASAVGMISPKVVIDTISPYTGYGGGIYSMHVVKRMVSKEDFLGMPSQVRNCEIEHFQDCRARMLLEECGCVPLEVPAYEVRGCS